MENDFKIVESIAKGDESAFATFYELYATRVYNIALSYTKIVHDAEEVTQDVFLKVFRHANSFQKKSAVSTWIYRITVNRCHDYIKKNSRTFVLSQEADKEKSTDFNHPGFILENKQKGKYLFLALDKLPQQQKTAFILGYLEHMPRKEIADILETSLKAVESLLQRAKKNLRIELGKIYPDR